MDEWTQLENALGEMTARGVEVHEDGEWLAELSGLNFEFRRQGKQAVLHLWSDQRNLARRVLRVDTVTPARIVLEVQRLGRPRPGRLEFLIRDAPRPAPRLTREKFRAKFRRMLKECFPDGQVESLISSADLEHSFSGIYPRGCLQERGRRWAILGASPSEDSIAIDGILTFGLLWLSWLREHSLRHAIEGLRLFVPEGSSRVLLQRVYALAPSSKTEIYEFSEVTSKVQKMEPSDNGNIESRLTVRREVEAAIASAGGVTEKIRSIIPESAEDIDCVIVPGAREVALRFRGLEFARWKENRLFFTLTNCEVSAHRWKELEKLMRQLDVHRSSLTEDVNHQLYRASPERWLEMLLARDPAQLDAHLDPLHFYSQVPAFAASDRGVLDLLGVTRDGRLVVIELKASEDIHLPVQAVDYWLRVRRHQRDGDFARCGYFSGVVLDDRPPLLWLVSPGLRFHPATDTILKHLSSEIQVTRIGLNENWRRGVKVIFRD